MNNHRTGKQYRTSDASAAPWLRGDELDNHLARLDPESAALVRECSDLREAMEKAEQHKIDNQNWDKPTARYPW